MRRLTFRVVEHQRLHRKLQGVHWIRGKPFGLGEGSLGLASESVYVHLGSVTNYWTSLCPFLQPKNELRDFSGCPVIKTLCSQHRKLRFHPGLGTKIPPSMVQPKKKRTSLKPSPIYLILMSEADKITKCQMNVLDKGCAVLMLSVLLLFNKANPPVKEMSTHHKINYRFFFKMTVYIERKASFLLHNFRISRVLEKY